MEIHLARKRATKSSCQLFFQEGGSPSTSFPNAFTFNLHMWKVPGLSGKPAVCLREGQLGLKYGNVPKRSAVFNEDLSKIHGFRGRVVQKQLLGGSGKVPWVAAEDTLKEIYKMLSAQPACLRENSLLLLATLPKKKLTRQVGCSSCKITGPGLPLSHTSPQPQNTLVPTVEHGFKTNF